jgi:hypothetical protein
MKIRHADGTAHFSLIKSFARSPLHYKYSCEIPFEATKTNG